jgi:glycosyltransferase involved in cell wall biosynthesis
VGGFCRQLLSGLVGEGHDVTVFSGGSAEDFRIAMGDLAPHATVISHPPQWEWNRWYSRNPLGVFFSSFWARRRAYSQVVRSLLAEHRRQPFDVVVQFSQTELFELLGQLDRLPPFLLFPCVHAAGELRWHRRESRLARRSESLLKHYAVRANLVHRAHLQRRCCRAVHGVVGMSKRFNQLLVEDYGVDPQNQTVVYQPIDPVDDTPEAIDEAAERPLRLLFVGRVSVRKGVEMLVELSRRLDGLADRVTLTIVGGTSFWSDYSGVLADLNPRIANWVGAKPHAEVVRLMSESDALVVPSHYEPGGIVVAEALSRGCVVIASDEVGSAEPLPDSVCRRFAAGDADALERIVRQLVDCPPDERQRLRREAQAVAASGFAPERTTAALVAALRAAVDRRRIGVASVQPECVPA